MQSYKQAASELENSNNHVPSSEMRDWDYYIKQWKGSGLPKASFCKANDISYHQFNYHLLKHRNQDKDIPKLLPVKIPTNQLPSSNYFILHYPNEMKLFIPMDMDATALKTLLPCLETSK